MKRRGKIVVLHFAGQMPLAGVAYQALHYLLGFEQLGYESWYIEDSGANPYDPRANSVVMGCDYNVAYLRRVMEDYGFGGRWAYWAAIQNVYHGLPWDRIRSLYAEAAAVMKTHGEPGAPAASAHETGAASSTMLIGDETMARSMWRRIRLTAGLRPA